MYRSRTIWIGFDSRQVDAFAVARASVRRHLVGPLPIRGLILDDLRAQGLYTRPTERRLGQLWDVISDAPCSTEFSISRFLVPHLAQFGWALFMDCDFLVRTNIGKLFDNLSRSKAVYCVKHDYAPTSTVKMDSQIQTTYPRKNWSSFLAINADHPSNKQLTPELVNSLPGRDLHRLCWLKDEEIGELGEEWNWLVGHSPSDIDPKAAHFTEGLPNLPAFRDVPFADEWRAELNRWAS